MEQWYFKHSTTVKSQMDWAHCLDANHCYMMHYGALVIVVNA